MYFVTTHADRDPHARVYPFHTYTEAVDRMAFIHTRLTDKGYLYQETREKEETAVRTYTQVGKPTVYLGIQHE